jgi:hypothetical protein
MNPFRALAPIAAALFIAGPAQAQDSTERLLAELADAPGPSGFEEAVRAIMVRALKPSADRITYDGVGQFPK